MSQPFFIPTLMPMHSLQKQHQVVISSSSGIPPVISTSAGLGQTTQGGVSVIPTTTTTVMQQPVMSAAPNLYLCSTSKNSSGTMIPVCVISLIIVCLT